MDSITEDKLVKVLEQGINRQLQYYLDVCTRCSICKDACHQYVATKDVKYLPAYRAELIRRLFKKYLTPEGKILPSLGESTGFDDRLLDELFVSTYACTGCRRCMYYCPFSIDTTWVLSLAKSILITAGKGSSILTELADASIMKGESIDLFKDIIIDTLKDTEKQLQEQVQDTKAVIPIDKEGAEILYVALSGVHSILPAAVIFHHAGADWTLSMFEAANYGYFLGDSRKAVKIADRIVEEAKRLKVKEVVITECGHAYRVMNLLYEFWTKEKHPFKVTSLLEVISRYIKEGKIKVKPGQVKDIVTYHDPCQFGRNAGFYDLPREIIREVTPNFTELVPNREKNWCCGGGGGLVAQPDFDELRIKSGIKKAEQIRASRAKIVVSPCENCRLQLDNLNEKYELGITISSMMDFVAGVLEISPSGAEKKSHGK